jgi:hypothetical protein
MTRFNYSWATPQQHGTFSVDERSESIANIEAKMTVERLVHPGDLLSFDLVSQGPAS